MDGDAPRQRRRTTPVGRTGARFAPAASLSDHPSPPASAPPAPRAPEVGPIGARFGPYSARRPAAHDLPIPEPARSESDRPAPLIRPRPAPEERLPSESSVMIRPYARTGGRTRPTHDLALEALISTTPGAPGRFLSREHRAVANLCVHPISVAEVAALLRIPLGVARVLLGDLATDGTVIVHRTHQSAPDLALMHRVLSGLRRL